MKHHDAITFIFETDTGEITRSFQGYNENLTADALKEIAAAWIAANAFGTTEAPLKSLKGITKETYQKEDLV